MQSKHKNVCMISRTKLIIKNNLKIQFHILMLLLNTNHICLFRLKFIVRLYFSGVILLKEKQYENVDKDLVLDVKEGKEEGSEIELDVKKEIEKVADVINNLKETALKMKGAEVKMKDWSLLVGCTEGEYIVDFKMNLSVKPEKM